MCDDTATGGLVAGPQSVNPSRSEDWTTAVRYAERCWVSHAWVASGMPQDRLAVKKLGGYLLRDLRVLGGAGLGPGSTAGGVLNSRECNS